MNMIIPVILLAISANLDTFTVAISYGIQKIKISMFTTLLITIITTSGTFLSMYFGLTLTNYISTDTSAFIGAIMLIGIGLYILVDDYRKKHVKVENKLIYSQILDDPASADIDNSGDLDIKESIALSLALTINNLGLGVAASMAGISIFLNTLSTLIFTILSVIIGVKIGRSFLSNLFGKYCSIISGLIIIAIGVYEAFL